MPLHPNHVALQKYTLVSSPLSSPHAIAWSFEESPLLAPLPEAPCISPRGRNSLKSQVIHDRSLHALGNLLSRSTSPASVLPNPTPPSCLHSTNPTLLPTTGTPPTPTQPPLHSTNSNHAPSALHQLQPRPISALHQPNPTLCTPPTPTPPPSLHSTNSNPGPLCTPPTPTLSPSERDNSNPPASAFYQLQLPPYPKSTNSNPFPSALQPHSPPFALHKLHPQNHFTDSNSPLRTPPPPTPLHTPPTHPPSALH
ncbi:uncharacterized protein [Macrobrachium rosenbergii]|uniref:uncharacterized protein n=1 Tax=Macrobrachium rosenbergii TaxID=79674 RepID=UPI0034D43B32